MRKILLLFYLSILFQGCFSYKNTTTNIDQLTLNKKYEVTLKNTSKLKGTLTKINENEIQMNSLKGDQQINVKRESIQTIAKRNFSILKTTGTGLGIIVGTLGVLLIIILTSW